ncbi:hypothetical protein [Corynebacterium phoceense]|uniref:hypothetical protein n=1 Tax=Corynebacterium phoceense TaxID=1686286 RepID=UPI000839D4A6|nr:hypothetical protein [Corynebacterium phoceense]
MITQVDLDAAIRQGAQAGEQLQARALVDADIVREVHERHRVRRRARRQERPRLGRRVVCGQKKTRAGQAQRGGRGKAVDRDAGGNLRGKALFQEPIEFGVFGAVGGGEEA